MTMRHQPIVRRVSAFGFLATLLAPVVLALGSLAFVSPAQAQIRCGGTCYESVDDCAAAICGPGTSCPQCEGGDCTSDPSCGTSTEPAAPPASSAPSAPGITIVPDCARANSLITPGLDCVMQAFMNIARLILGITGSFALFMFVYGGFMLLTSGGVEAKVTQGKTILKNAVIGIFLVFTAFYIIDYALSKVQATPTGATPNGPCLGGAGHYVQAGGSLQCRPNCPTTGGYSCQTGSTNPGCADDYWCATGTCCPTAAP